MEFEIIDNKKYYWVDMSREDLDEFINTGLLFSFRHDNKDYIIEGVSFDNEAKGRVGCYVIGDDSGQHPESRQARTPDEFRALPFIKGKTIMECFDELHFYDD
jgi:hypothetical protein